MSLDNAARRNGVAKPQVVTAGLSTDERCLVCRAAGRDSAVVDADDAFWVATAAAEVYGIVLVASLDWLESRSLVGLLGLTTEHWRGVLLVPASASGERQLWAAQHAPVAQLVVIGLNNSALALRDALTRVRHDSVARALVSRIGDIHISFAFYVLARALFIDQEVASVSTLARAMHRHERTLRRQLASTHPCLPPQRILGWARLLHAVWYLRYPELTVEQVTRRVHISAAPNLYRLLRTYTGFTVHQVRTTHADPIDLLLAGFRKDATGG